MCRQEQWTSVELHVDEEHCECKDIRKIVQMWQKMNMNFLEVLFTGDYYINPKYLRDNEVMETWHQILSYNNDMAYYDVNKAFMSVIGQTKGTAKASEITATKVMTIARLVMVLEKLNRNVPYEQIVRCSAIEQEALLKLKTEYEKEKGRRYVDQRRTAYYRGMPQGVSGAVSASAHCAHHCICCTGYHAGDADHFFKIHSRL